MTSFRNIKYVIFVAVTALIASADGYAQRRNSTLRFETEVADMGTIAEADGPVSYIFKFRNTGSSAVVIERVNTDCGCTVPEYDRKPIRPRGEGTVKVTMDPAGYAGEMRKCVTVFSNGGKNRNMLCLTANVIPRPRTLEEEYPFTLSDGLRANTLSSAMQYVHNNSSKSDTIRLVNNSGKPVTLSLSNESGSNPVLKVSAPSQLKAQEKGIVILTYDLTGNDPVYGMLSDRIYVTVNGKRTGLPLSVHAIGVDDFSAIDRKAVPVCSISPVFHNFGPAKAGDKLSKEFRITNTGNGTLIIRDVSARSNTACDLKAGTAIPPGKTISTTVTMTVPGESRGSVAAGGITLIVNDPDRPMRDIRTAVEVER